MTPINEKETTDVVIEEMRRIKEVLAASMDFDIGRILQDALDRQNHSGRKVLVPPIRQGG